MANIIIADSQPLFAFGMKCLLQTKGHSVVNIATTGRQLKEAIRRRSIDLVILYSKIAGHGNGRLLRDLYEAHGNFVVMITADTLSREEIVRARRLGVTGFVGRDREPRVFLNSVQKVLDGRACWVIKVTQTAENKMKEHALTDREIEIAQLLASGISNKQIAEEAFVTPGTVKIHAVHIYKKLGISSRYELMSIMNNLKTA